MDPRDWYGCSPVLVRVWFRCSGRISHPISNTTIALTTAGARSQLVLCRPSGRRGRGWRRRGQTARATKIARHSPYIPAEREIPCTWGSAPHLRLSPPRAPIKKITTHPRRRSPAVVVGPAADSQDRGTSRAHSDGRRARLSDKIVRRPHQRAPLPAAGVCPAAPAS